MENPPISCVFLGVVNYEKTALAMQEYTLLRQNRLHVEQSLTQSKSAHADEIWICQHPSVYTQGLAGKPEHLLNPTAIPVVQTNRGGQITYHGPGQIVAYPLLDLKRLGYFVKEYVYRLEEATLRTLAHFGVTGHRIATAPGIYVRSDDPFSHSVLTQRTAQDFQGLGKIAALGIKVSGHCTYHGLALNVAMDLLPFTHINPCGYSSLKTVDLASLGVAVDADEVARVLAEKLQVHLAK